MRKKQTKIQIVYDLDFDVRAQKFYIYDGL